MSEDFEHILGLLVAFIILGLILKGYKKMKANWKTMELNRSVQVVESIVFKVNRAVNQKQKQLSIQRKKTVYLDPYGKENIENWYFKEIPYFVSNYIYPKLSDVEKIYFEMEQAKFFEIIDFAAKSNPPQIVFKINMTGVEFEQFCAQKLEDEGWKVNTTKNSGDQGIDLIIEKGHKKIGVQCKKYAKPVGNKAVQEVKAGLNYYGLQHGVVIVSSTFTKSAIELANMNNIKLIHYLETDTL